MSDEVRVLTFKALNISRQHWTMAAVPCACGAGWDKGSQGQAAGPDGTV